MTDLLLGADDSFKRLARGQKFLQASGPWPSSVWPVARDSGALISWKRRFSASAQPNKIARGGRWLGVTRVLFKLLLASAGVTLASLLVSLPLVSLLASRPLWVPPLPSLPWAFDVSSDKCH